MQQCPLVPPRRPATRYAPRHNQECQPAHTTIQGTRETHRSTTTGNSHHTAGVRPNSVMDALKPVPVEQQLHGLEEYKQADLTVVSKASGASLAHHRHVAGAASLKPSADRFIIHVPYCDSHFKMQVIFNAGFPDQPPDVVLLHVSSAITFGDVDSLKEWDSSDPRSLLKLVLECRYRYQQEMADRVKSACAVAPRVQFHLETIKDTDAEYLYDDMAHEIRVLIPLKMENDVFTHVLARVPLLNPTHLFRVVVAFGLATPNKAPTVKLIPPQALRHLVQELKLPTWSSVDSLLHLIESSEQVLNKSIRAQLANSEHRSALLNQLISKLGSPLEFDSVNHFRIAFLFLHGKRKEPCLVRVELDAHYPSSAPVLHVSSVERLQNRKPLTKVLTKFPYNQTWTAEQVSTQIRLVLKEYVPRFLAWAANLGS